MRSVYLFLFSLLLALGGCSTINVSTDYALEQDFSAYRNYQWHPDGIEKSASLDAMGGDIFDTRIRRLIEQTMASKGMAKAEPADFYVNYSVVTEDRVSINTYNTYGGYGPGWGYYGYGYGYGAWGMGGTQTSVSYYTQGTIIIDIVDAGTNTLVFRATADSTLQQSANPAQKERDLSQALTKMFTDFPPGAIPR